MATQYKIGGITVEFPFKAYGPQLAYMSKVVTTLEQSRLRSEGRCNALLESPTGSGKSLALLCATLAWQQHYKNLLNSRSTSTCPAGDSANSKDVLVTGGGFILEDPAEDVQQIPSNGNRQTEIKPKVPRIFYATRTHSQITQVIREFRKTKYRVPMAVLASKKHYCTNKQVLKKKNVDEDCLVLLREPEQPGCRNFKNMAKVKAHPSIQPGACNDVHDIEDLVKIGHSVKGCSYFAARAMAMEAEIVFCPYSYIIDPIIREAMEIDIQGSIIILDEAHNIEDVARDAGSIELEMSVLSDLQLELEQLCTFQPSADYSQPLLEMVQDLTAWIGHQTRNFTHLEFEHHWSSWTGDKAVQELRSAGVPLESFEVLSSCCKKAVSAASDENVSHLSGHLVKSLQRLFKVLQFMLSNNARRTVDYQLVLRNYLKRDPALVAGGWVITFNLWCLNPEVVFEEIAAASRSIVVTSGTLAPVESFASELGVSFDVRIEAPHVVDMNTQVWATALSVGPRGVVLNASYKNAENFIFQDAVGAALLEIFKVTPNGVLVFFPSYKLLTKLCDRWRSTGHWLLLVAQKQLFTEPRVNDEGFESVLKEYYGAIDGKPPEPSKKSKKRALGKTNAKVQAPADQIKTNGAAFLAVCRGKVSEGIDFSDGYARAVVMIGIPFPNVKDIHVSLKKQYNSAHKLRKLLSGDQWYCQQAFRALNQAVGRCIRHRYDYGGIVLLDERFKVSRNVEYMSKWLRKSVRLSQNFEASMAELHGFFNRLKECDLRASSCGAGVSNPPRVLPEFSIPWTHKIPSPITPVPKTPLKSTSGLLRVSEKLELCITSKTLINQSQVVAAVPGSPCIRSDLLPQFDESEPNEPNEPNPGHSPSFHDGGIFAENKASHVGMVTEFGQRILTQSYSSEATTVLSKGKNGHRNFSVGAVSGDIDQPQCAADPRSWSERFVGASSGEIDQPPCAADPRSCSGRFAPYPNEAEEFTISIADDDVQSMAVLECDMEQWSPSLSTGWQPPLSRSIGTSVLYSEFNNGDINEDPPSVSLARACRDNEQPQSAADRLNCSLRTGSKAEGAAAMSNADDERHGMGRKHLGDDKGIRLGGKFKMDSIRSSGVSVLDIGLRRIDEQNSAWQCCSPDEPCLGNTGPHATMCCGRCGVTFGIIRTSGITALQKSYLTSLLSMNSSPPKRAWSPTLVYLTDISVISPGLSEKADPQPGSLMVSLSTDKKQCGGVWVEEDGCVFKPLMCSSCTNFNVGVHIVAADCNNLALTGKVAIFVDSVNFMPEGKTLR